MDYNPAGQGMAGCYLLFSVLHQHTCLSYDILREISKKGEYKCGWAAAVETSGKAKLFVPVIGSEMLHPSCKFPKRRKLSEESISFDKELKKRRLNFFNMEDNEDDESLL